MDYFIIFSVTASIATATVLFFLYIERHSLQYLRFLRFIASWSFHITVLTVIFGTEYLFAENKTVVNAMWSLFFFPYLSIILPLNYNYTFRGRRAELQALESGDDLKVVEIRDNYKKLKIAFLVLVLLAIAWNLITA